MRLTFYVLAILLFISSCKSDNVEKITNLLKDGSISEGSTYWKYASNRYGEVLNPTESKDFIGSISNDRFTSGLSSLKISRLQSTEKDRAAYWYQDVINPSIPKGSNLKLTARIRTENLEGGRVSMYIVGLFDNGKKENYFNTTESTQKIDGTSDFKEYTLRLENYLDKYAPTEQLRVGFYISGPTTGIVYIDDISLIIE